MNLQLIRSSQDCECYPHGTSHHHTLSSASMMMDNAVHLIQVSTLPNTYITSIEVYIKEGFIKKCQAFEFWLQNLY